MADATSLDFTFRVNGDNVAIAAMKRLGDALKTVASSASLVSDETGKMTLKLRGLAGVAAGAGVSVSGALTGAVRGVSGVVSGAAKGAEGIVTTALHGVEEIGQGIFDAADAIVQKTEQIGKAAIQLGVVFGSLAAIGIGEFAKKSIEEFNDYQKSIQATSAAIVSMGRSSEFTTDDLVGLAKSFEANSIFNRTDILNSLIANLVSFGNISGSVFNGAAQAALNLSSRLGEDLQHATIQVGKALNDPVRGIGALRRVGVTFDATAVTMIKNLVAQNDLYDAQTFILAQLNKEVGGQAAALAQTNYGKYQVSLNKFKDAMQDLGGVIRQVLPGAGPIILDVANAIELLVSYVQRGNRIQLLQNMFAQFAAGVSAAAKKVLIAVAIMIGGFDGFLKVIAAIEPLNVQFLDIDRYHDFALEVVQVRNIMTTLFQAISIGGKAAFDILREFLAGFFGANGFGDVTSILQAVANGVLALAKRFQAFSSDPAIFSFGQKVRAALDDLYARVKTIFTDAEGPVHGFGLFIESFLPQSVDGAINAIVGIGETIFKILLRMEPILAGLLQPFGLLLNPLDQAKGPLEQFADVVNDVNSKLQVLLNNGSVDKFAQNVGEDVKGAVTAILGFGQALDLLFKNDDADDATLAKKFSYGPALITTRNAIEAVYEEFKNFAAGVSGFWKKWGGDITAVYLAIASLLDPLAHLLGMRSGLELLAVAFGVRLLTGINLFKLSLALINGAWKFPGYIIDAITLGGEANKLGAVLDGVGAAAVRMGGFLSGAWNAGVTAATAAAEFIGSAFSAVPGAVSSAAAGIGEASAGLWAGVTAGASAAVDAVVAGAVAAGNGIIAGLTAAYEFVLGLPAAITAAFEGIQAGIALAGEAVAGFITGIPATLSGIAATVSAAWSAAVGAVSEAVAAIPGILAGVGETISATFAGASATVGESLAAIPGLISGAASAAAEFFGGLASQAAAGVAAAGEALAGLGAAVLEGLGSIAAVGVEIGGAILSSLGAIVTGIVGVFGAIVEAGIAIFGAAAAAIPGGVVALVVGIVAIVLGLCYAFRDDIEDLFHTIGDFIYGILVDLFGTKVANVITNAFNFLVQPIKDVWNGIMDAISSILTLGFSGVVSKVEGWFSALGQKVGSWFGFGSGSPAAPANDNAAPAAPGYAKGGAIRGKGGPRTDSILAWLSNGEYVINAASARIFGPLLDAINYGGTNVRSMLSRRGMPAFANGGQVNLQRLAVPIAGTGYGGGMKTINAYLDGAPFLGGLPMFTNASDDQVMKAVRNHNRGRVRGSPMAMR